VIGFARGDDGKWVGVRGDEWVLAVEFGANGPRAYSVLAYGESDDPASPHRTDQAALFARGELKPVAFTERESGRLPLGSGALAGVNCDPDRWQVAQALGFDSVAPNSIDAVSGRDFILDSLSAAATCSTHLSRLGAELVLWSSSEFGFCELSDAWSSGSSIMPQKKNPDAAELLRAKAPRVVGHLSAFHGVIHALPLTYNKDLQEDKEHLFDSVDTLELTLAAAAGMLTWLARYIVERSS
jgi:argininosuccinate lyase